MSSSFFLFFFSFFLPFFKTIYSLFVFKRGRGGKKIIFQLPLKRRIMFSAFWSMSVWQHVSRGWTQNCGMTLRLAPCAFQKCCIVYTGEKIGMTLRLAPFAFQKFRIVYTGERIGENETHCIMLLAPLSQEA